VRLAAKFVIITRFKHPVTDVTLYPVNKICLIAGLLSFGHAAAETVTLVDWQPWDAMSAADQWGVAPYCPGGYVAPPSDAPVMEPGDSHFQFDRAIRQSDQQTTFDGNVIIHGRNQRANANQAVYSPNEATSRLDGDVIIRTPEMVLSGANAEIDLQTDAALLNNAQFALYQRDLHGSADEIRRTEANRVVAKRLSFTRCAPSSNAWRLRSGKLTINNDTGIATAWNSRLEIQRLPVLYIPYISFPVNGQARTGVLIPTFGTGYSQPYYLNLASNVDDTVTLDYQPLYGLLLNNEFRFLTERHNGISDWGFQLATPTDNTLATEADSTLVEPVSDLSRWSLAHKQSGALTDTLGYDFSARWVSDQNYDPTFKPGAAQVSQQVANFALKQQFGTRSNGLKLAYTQPVIDSAEKFQTLDSTLTTAKAGNSAQLLYQTQQPFDQVTKPVSASDYELIKQPELSLVHKSAWQTLGLQSSERFSYGLFTRALPAAQKTLLLDNALTTALAATPAGDPLPTLAEAALVDDTLALADQSHRFHGALALTRPFDAGWGYFRPSVEGFATAYDIDNDLGYDLKAAYGGDNINQLAWRASLDQGLTLSLRGQHWQQTLKPRLYYAYAPLTEQAAPILDSTETTTFTLFSPSRYSSVDRIGDLSRLSTSLSYDLNWTGDDRLVLNLTAQKGIKLAQERLLTTGVADIDADWQPEYSDWLGSSELNLSRDLSLTASASVAHEWDQLNLFALAANYRPSGQAFMQLSADKAVIDSELTHSLNAGAYVPILQNVALIGYAQAQTTDLDPQWSDFRVQQVLYGIDYDNCCWNIRLAALEVTDIDDESVSLFPLLVERRYFFEFTLKGLAAGAGTIEDILNRLDFGYSGKLFNYR